MSRDASPPLISTRRPVPLQRRADLICERAVYQGEPCWIVKDPLSLQYVRLGEEQYHALRLLDGRRSLEELRSGLQREFPTLRPRLSDVQSLVLDLHQKNLLCSGRPGQAAEVLKRERRRRWNALRSAAWSFLYIRLPGWDPERTLQRVYPLVRWMFHPLAVVACGVLIAASWLLLLVQFGRLEQPLADMQDFLIWPGPVALWLTIGAAKVVHEMAHALACKHFGGECHEIGVAFLVFSPCLYCDVSDSWILPDKWKRILIASAGMYIELVISALAAFGWWFTRPGPVNLLCLAVFLVTTLTTILFNANPLLRFDGYYILSDLLEIPNLRSRSEQLLFQTFCRTCLGIRVPGPAWTSQARHVWLAAYAVAAAAYRWFLAFAVIGVLYALLKPYGLAWFGLGLGVGSAALVLGRIALSILRQIAATGPESMNYLRGGIVLAIVVMLLAAVLKLPLPLHAESPLLIEPSRVQHVYISTPGRLEEIHVQPGQRVRRGDRLISLSNFEKEDRCRQLHAAEAVQTIEVALQRALGDAAQEQLALGTLQAVQEQLADCRRQLEQLIIVAPCDGLVIAAPGRPAPPADEASSSLPDWSGTPLDPENLGCHLQRGTHLLGIAPEAGYQAVVLVDQEHRNELVAGQPVEIKLEHDPGRTHPGRISTISSQHLEFAPAVLAARHGGALPTRTDPQGRERLESIAYQVTVPLDAERGLLKPGLRGRARFEISRRSLGEWLLRQLHRTFRFRL